MSRYRPTLIDGVIGLRLRAAAAGAAQSAARQAAGAPDAIAAGQEDGREGARKTSAEGALRRARISLAEPGALTGEPDGARGTLAEWRAWQARLLDLPRDDEGVRFALAVAEARIAKLRARAARPEAAGRDAPGPSDAP